MRVRGWRGGWGFAVPAVLAAACLPLGISAPPADVPQGPARAIPEAPGAAPVWVGTGRCSARGCHGAVAPESTKGSEYNTWKAFDKHSRAFTILLDERSRRIEMNLKGLKDEQAAHAETDALCLKCHSQPAPEPPLASPALTTGGVGCESCHGPAGNWLDAHYAASWKKAGASEKRAKGMVVMDTAAALTWVCVRCHVGTGDREVNHDLIAAGHPRLNFEALAYLDDMPKHWDEADVDRKFGPFTAAENWAVGQVVTARAAVGLLKDRTADEREPRWPEFTEYGCFACHHDLRNQGMKFWREDLGLRPGALPWGTWMFPLVRELAVQPGGPAELPEDLDDLGRLMGAPVPDRQRVQQQAEDVAQALDGWLDRLQADRFDCQRLRALLISVRTDEAALRRLTAHWDGAAQLYLALVAMQECLASDPALQEALDALRILLDFHPGQDSPGTKYDPKPVREAVDKVLESLPEP